MTRLLPITALLVACSDAGVTKFNTDPTAEISSHASGDTVREGYPETLRATVGDANHGIEPLTVAWVVDGINVCLGATPDEDGLVTCDHTFLPTGGEILLEVRDPEGGSGSVRVTVDVQPTDAPVAMITEPTTSGVYYSDHLTTLAGQVSDLEEDSTALIVAWESTLDGVLIGGFDTPDSEGGLLGAATLQEGEHFLTLTVIDSTGKEGRDSVTFRVGPPNTLPSCEITAPEDGSAGGEGQEVRFEAVVSDPDVPASVLTATWTSDVDDVLRESTPDSDGTTGFAYNALSRASHRITLTVTDETGAECTDSVYYTVGTPPELVVTSPLSGDVLNETEPVAFTGSAIDEQDVETDIALEWSSDVDGTFSTEGGDSDGDIDFFATLSSGPHTITVRATDTDGLYDQTSFGITINEVPTQPTVTIDPDPAYTANTLTASASGSTDPDASGTVTYSYAWYEDGILSSVSTTATFPASDTAKDHTYRVVVTPSDGTGPGATGEAERTVDNTDPVLTGPTLSAGTVVVGDTLTCTASATDADGDTVSITYAWPDSSTGPTYAVTSSDDPGDTITCTATADDADGGVVTGTASATVTNTDPVIDSISVSPSTGQVGDTLTCAATATDDDGGTPTISYAWPDGSTAATYPIVDSDDPGDTITCTATATDVNGGTDTGTASATVTNTDPVLGTVSVSPSTGTVGDTLTCAATATDDDGGTPTISYAWPDGSTAPTYPIVVSDDPGDTITCTATATDSDGGTDTGTDSATVTNTDPVMGTVSVSPSTGQVGDTLTCAATATDDDGGTPTISYAWPDGSTAATYPIVDSDDPGDTITCTATATDIDGGTDTGTASATVTNTDPVIDSISVSPSTGQVGDTLTCAATATDDDGGTPTVSYAWPDGSTAATYPIVVSDDPGDTITCTATATDINGGTDTGTASATVDNTDPVIDSISVSPSTGQVGDTLTCAATATDDDGGTPTISYAWPDGSTAATYTIVDSDDPGDTITCIATVTDINGGTDTGTASATVTNTDPVIDSISVSPSSGAVDQDLTCVVTATDADGGTPTVSYAWTDGSTLATYTIVDSDDPGDTITCTATATDVNGGTDTGTASATVTNTDPVIDSISVSPSSGPVGQLLTCAATATDADGGTPTVSYAWTDGSTAATYTIVDSDDPGDVITCTATATDTDLGAGSSAASATVDNTDPVLGTVSITPATANNDDTLTCAASATDVDGGTPTVTYAWSGSTSGSLGSGSTVDLSTTSATSGETITCTATATDTDLGTDAGTATRSLDNRSPTVSVSLSPTSGATAASTLTCSATASDDDLDSVSLTFSWTVSGTSVSATSTSVSDSTLEDAFAGGDTVLCAVTADDGKGGTDTDSTSVSIDNTAPVITDVSLSSTDPTTDETLVATVTATDADDDTLTTTYAWSVAGTVVQSGSNDSLDGETDFERGESVYVTVTVSDASDSDSASSVTVVVANTPPSAPVVSISPSEATTGDSLQCLIDSISTDDDTSDTVTYMVSWTVDGVEYVAGGAVDTGSDVWTGPSTTDETDDTVSADDTEVVGETFVCTVTPDDGTEEGESATAEVTMSLPCDDGSIQESASGLSFTVICAGTFEQGCTSEQLPYCRTDEAPSRNVTLTYPYYMATTEMTVTQYQALTGNNPNATEYCNSGTCAVIDLTWYMAANAANLMSIDAGLDECYSCSGSGTSVHCSQILGPYECDGYRLPTEAEWEKAARCDEGYIYASSDHATDGWYASNGSSRGHNVALKFANGCGLYDMSGNAREWVSDYFLSTEYSTGDITDPEGGASTGSRIMRGGDSFAWAGWLRVSSRDEEPAGSRSGAVNGVRVVRTVF